MFFFIKVLLSFFSIEDIITNQFSTPQQQLGYFSMLEIVLREKRVTFNIIFFNQNAADILWHF